MKHVLIVDDEPAICWGFRKLLTAEGYDVSVASSAEEGLQCAERRKVDAVVLDVRLPGMDGLTAVREFRSMAGEVPIVVMTAFGSLETAVRAIESGVVEYLPKPFDLDDATRLIHRVMNESSTGPATMGAPAASDALRDRDALIGASAAMQQIFKQIALAASSDVPVLISGESGVGKELVARAIHRHSARGGAAFLPMSPAALTPSLVESELFGCVQGAFGGAGGDRGGVFELVAGGTVMLDEIGDLTPEMQVKLLRTIERKEVQRIGDAQVRSVDFRIIAATHRNLPALLDQGAFRDDLLERLRVFHIRIPPLRERREDIPDLAAFLRQCQSADRPQAFTADAMRELQARPWRGNIRELRNAVEHASIITRCREIGPNALPDARRGSPGDGTVEDDLRMATRRWTQSALADDDPEIGVQLHERLLQIVEPELLYETLSAHHGNRAATAERLGMHRATLRQKLRRYAIDGASEDPSE